MYDFFGGLVALWYALLLIAGSIIVVQVIIILGKVIGRGW